jgi:hypothetical protein
VEKLKLSGATVLAVRPWLGCVIGPRRKDAPNRKVYHMGII